MITCLKCDQESKKGELVFNVYETTGDGRMPTSNQWSSGFVHVECPPVNAPTIVEDTCPDSFNPVEGGEEALKYVQEHAFD